jgi:hypothetical protein
VEDICIRKIKKIVGILQKKRLPKSAVEHSGTRSSGRSRKKDGKTSSLITVDGTGGRRRI